MMKKVLLIFGSVSFLFYIFCGVTALYSRRNKSAENKESNLERKVIRLMGEKIDSYNKLCEFELDKPLESADGKEVKIEELNKKSNTVFYLVPPKYCADCAEPLYLQLAEELEHNNGDFYLILTRKSFEKVKGSDFFRRLRKRTFITDMNSNKQFNQSVSKPYMFTLDRYGNIKHLMLLKKHNILNPLKL